MMEREEKGLYFYGITRTRGWRNNKNDAEFVRVRFRDLEAITRPIEFELPPLDDEHVRNHQQVVEQVMRRTTVLPAPFGIVFSGRRALIQFLQDQYLMLDEALAFIDGHWELRMHIYAAVPGEPSPELNESATSIYADMRRLARAAVPFRQETDKLLSAAFLVDRASWIDFVQRSEDLGTANAELTIDITGPWPPYDFVRVAEAHDPNET
jgi:hypothetical protein